MARFIQEGDSIDYTPGAAVSSGAVVIIGDVVGIANHDIAASTLGSIRVEGIVGLPTASATVFAAGAKVYVNTGTLLATTATGDKFAGYAAKACANGETEVIVKLDR